MRLIDADNLETTVVLGLQLQHADSRYYYFYAEEDIEKAPTVKAIPIELYEQVKGERDVAIEQLKALNIELFEKPYLKAIPIEWIEEYAKDLITKRRLLAENGYRDNRCYDYMFGIISMLLDWRKKENDR